MEWHLLAPPFYGHEKSHHKKYTRCSEPLAQQAKCDHVIRCGIGVESGGTLSVLLAFLGAWEPGTARKAPRANGHPPPVPDLSALSESWIDSFSQLWSWVTVSENEKCKGSNGSEVWIHHFRRSLLRRRQNLDGSTISLALYEFCPSSQHFVILAKLILSSRFYDAFLSLWCLLHAW